MSDQDRVLLLFFHPALHKSRVNRSMLRAVEDLAAITVRLMYEEYPSFHIDVKREQALLLEHDIIVWQHPFYWYSAPSLLKEWIDLVLEHGFAYGRNGNALQGKRVLQAITAGGRREAYCAAGDNHYTINQLLSPFEQTVKLCKMTYLPPFVVHGTHLLEPQEIVQQSVLYRQALLHLAADKPVPEVFEGCAYLNDWIEPLAEKV
jgi:glutathione-regulated potassium-efflux system ancillary protein KefG